MIGDTPALRKMGGFASHSGNIFCIYCNLTSKELLNFQKESWPQKTDDDHIMWAQKSLNASSLNEQKNILHDHGARYTVFQKLPYWKPTKMITIDVMHTFLLGMLRDYSLTYLGVAKAGQILHKKLHTHQFIPYNQSQGQMSSNSSQRRKRSLSPDGSNVKSKKRVKRATAAHQEQIVPSKTNIQKKVETWKSQSFSPPLASSSKNVIPTVVIPKIPGLHSPHSSSRSDSGVINQPNLSQRHSPRLLERSPVPSLRESVLKRKGKEKEASASNQSDGVQRLKSNTSDSLGSWEDIESENISVSKQSMQNSSFSGIQPFDSN